MLIPFFGVTESWNYGVFYWLSNFFFLVMKRSGTVYFWVSWYLCFVWLFSILVSFSMMFLAIWALSWPRVSLLSGITGVTGILQPISGTWSITWDSFDSYESLELEDISPDLVFERFYLELIILNKIIILIKNIKKIKKKYFFPYRVKWSLSW